MLQNYFKLALRNLLKRPGYAALHLLGLATGMACCLLILQYVLYERSYDRFHLGAERIVRCDLKAARPYWAMHGVPLPAKAGGANCTGSRLCRRPAATASPGQPAEILLKPWLLSSRCGRCFAHICDP